MPVAQTRGLCSRKLTIDGNASAHAGLAALGKDEAIAEIAEAEMSRDDSSPHIAPEIRHSATEVLALKESLVWRALAASRHFSPLKKSHRRYAHAGHHDRPLVPYDFSPNWSNERRCGAVDTGEHWHVRMVIGGPSHLVA